MKSPEQVGGPPKQPKGESVIDKKKNEETPEKPERKITTPEEASEMTRQRRKDFGLEEQGEQSPEKIRELDGTVEKLLGG